MATTPQQKREYRERHKERLQTKERDRSIDRATNGYWADRRKVIRSTKEFVGVDGEGWELENGYHAYFLLRVGERTLWPREGEARLRTNDMLAFLADLPTDKEYVGFFFGYDSAKILEDLSLYKLDRLVKRETRRRKHGGFWPIDWNGFEIDYMPGKEL